MPPLPNPRHERFAQLRAEGKSASAAYEQSGYQRDTGNAIRLTANNRVKMRITELMAKNEREHGITVASLCDELNRAVAMAEQRGQPQVLVSAAALKARLAGLDRQKIEIEDGSYRRLQTADDVLAAFVSEFGDDPQEALNILDKLRDAIEERAGIRAKLIDKST